VAVIGAGITGLLTALALQRDGASVALLEAGRVASGTTGYTTAKVSVLHGLRYADIRSRHGDDGARAYASANSAGLVHIARLVGELAIDCDFERLPAYTYVTTAEAVKDVEAEVEAATASGLVATFETDLGLPFATMGAIRIPDQAQFHPRRFCVAIAAELARSGVAVHEATRAVDVDTSDSSCAVKTFGGAVVHAERVVLATQLPFVDPARLFAKTRPSRSYAMVVDVDGKLPMGMFLGVDDPTRSLRPVTTAGSRLVVGGETHPVGEDDDTTQRYAVLERWASQHFAVRKIEQQWSAQDYLPADGVPYIGALDSDGRLFGAAGFNKWGMTHGAVAAALITDAIAGRANAWAELYDAKRSIPLRSMPAVLGQGAKSGARLAAGAVGRAPKCTHMGCALAFNTAERSWDCACHGSRFTEAGAVLQGPATTDLDLT